MWFLPTARLLCHPNIPLLNPRHPFRDKGPMGPVEVGLLATSSTPVTVALSSHPERSYMHVAHGSACALQSSAATVALIGPSTEAITEKRLVRDAARPFPHPLNQE